MIGGSWLQSGERTPRKHRGGVRGIRPEFIQLRPLGEPNSASLRRTQLLGQGRPCCRDGSWGAPELGSWGSLVRNSCLYFIYWPDQVASRKPVSHGSRLVYQRFEPHKNLEFTKKLTLEVHLPKSAQQCSPPIECTILYPKVKI